MQEYKHELTDLVVLWAVGPVEACAQAEVCQLYVTRLIDKDIVWFYVLF